MTSRVILLFYSGAINKILILNELHCGRDVAMWSVCLCSVSGNRSRRSHAHFTARRLKACPAKSAPLPATNLRYIPEKERYPVLYRVTCSN